MKLSKKLTTLAIVGAMSATAAVASAANIGLVNMSQVVNSYPGYGALDMKMQQVDAQYRPQIEKKVQEIEKIKDSAQAEAEFNKTVAPLLQKENEEINKIAQPMMQAIHHNTVEAIRVEKQMDVVLDDPYTIRAADANSKIENITNEVISRLKK
ncbi:MAG: OmpH family outer membrane protein [Veillonella sp.]|nr:OmpH family outer membrane protein [Veillonella sp.]